MFSTEKTLKILKHLMPDLYQFAKRELNFSNDIAGVVFKQTNEAEAKIASLGIVLGSTGAYDPVNKKIVLYISGRSPKDILRSFAHELVHHAQLDRGDLSEDDLMEVSPGYAQKSGKLRGMESEAYTRGNLILRDWEDDKKESADMQQVLAESMQTTSQAQAGSSAQTIRGGAGNDDVTQYKQQARKALAALDELRADMISSGGAQLGRDEISFDQAFRTMFDPLFESMGFKINSLNMISNYSYGYSYPLNQGGGHVNLIVFVAGENGIPDHKHPHSEDTDILLRIEVPESESDVGVHRYKYASFAELMKQLVDVLNQTFVMREGER